MIYDCTTFLGGPAEAKLLRIRCETLKHLKPIHVLVESTFTFSGKPKQLYFAQHKDEFKEYPIIYIVLNDPPHADPWQNEKLQRNAIATALQGCDNYDVILIGDIDEIPNPSVVESYDPSTGPACLEQDLFYFYLNVLGARAAWRIAKITPWGYLKNTTPDEFRNAGLERVIKDAGWHCTYQGGVNAMIEKFASFSHQEEAVQKHGKPDILAYKFANLESLFGEDRYSTVPLSELPKYVQDHPEEFKEMLYGG